MVFYPFFYPSCLSFLPRFFNVTPITIRSGTITKINIELKEASLEVNTSIEKNMNPMENSIEKTLPIVSM